MYVKRSTVALSLNIIISLDNHKGLIPYHSKKELLWRFSAAGKNKTSVCLHVECPKILSDFKEIPIFASISTKVRNIVLQGNPSSGSSADV